jgi:hypothetical protein
MGRGGREIIIEEDNGGEKRFPTEYARIELQKV